MKYAGVFIPAFILGAFNLIYVIGPRHAGLPCRPVTHVIEVPAANVVHYPLVRRHKSLAEFRNDVQVLLLQQEFARSLFVEGEAYFDVAKDPEHSPLLSEEAGLRQKYWNKV
jgi:hypothetical protein